MFIIGYLVWNFPSSNGMAQNYHFQEELRGLERPITFIFRTDYVVWNGPDAELRKGTSKGLARGPNPEFCSGPQVHSQNPNTEL